MHTISWVQQTCFYLRRQILAVCTQLDRDITARLVTALVLLRLDYCNAVLVDLLASTLALFQRVLYAPHVPFWSLSRMTM